jgi:hypothetical protein
LNLGRNPVYSVGLRRRCAIFNFFEFDIFFSKKKAVEKEKKPKKKQNKQPKNERRRFRFASFLPSSSIRRSRGEDKRAKEKTPFLWRKGNPPFFFSFFFSQS